MYISGCVIERPRLPKPKLTDSRPYSSQLPYLHDIRSLSHIKQPSKPAVNRTSSHCKVPLSKKKQLDIHLKGIIKDQVLTLQKNKIDLCKTQKRGQIDKSTSKKKIPKTTETNFKSQYPQFKLSLHFRYYPLIIVNAAGAREEFLQSLLEKGDFQTYNPIKKKLVKKNIQEIIAKLTKLASLRGKYKYRQKFNYMNSAQLKAMNYKKKELKKKKQSQSSSSDDQTEKKEKCRNMETWKKVMGVEENKVFIVKGKYKDFRDALLARGWVQNQDRHSTYYDLKWTTKVSDIHFDTLKPNQIVNHFNNNACLTSKYGLCKSLRSIMFTEGIDVDAFFPKAYDLSDNGDFQNFVQVYKWIYCESILKNFMFQMQSKQQSLVSVAVALIVTERRLLSLTLNVANTLNGRFNLCSINEWNLLIGQKYNNQLIRESLLKWDLLQMNHLRERIKQILERLKWMEPQYNLNQKGNIWIVKPAFLSRGRGIKCIVNFNDIIDYGLGKETQYVVQKYIENPLIINSKKFDIRQWVIVQDYNPPKIWIYGQFYVRFCLQNYNPNKINNKYAHLTNNSIQKNNKATMAQLATQSMWTQEQLKQYIDGKFGQTKFATVLSKMKEIIIATILSTQDQVYGRKNSFELIGYDFMIDDQLNPWLIEINSSPSMDYSTPVTRRLVKMVLEDTCKVVIDFNKKKSKKKNAGLFKCVYQGEGDYSFKHYLLPNPIKPHQ